MQMIGLRFFLVHKMYMDLMRFTKKITRLMPSCIVLVGLITLLLLTLIQLIAYQPDFVNLSTLPEPSELIGNSTTDRNSNISHSNNLIKNLNVHTNTSSHLKSSLSIKKSFTTSLSSFTSSSSLSSSLSPIIITTSPIKSDSQNSSSFSAARSSKNANSNNSNTINVTNHDLSNVRTGLSRMIISSNRTNLLKAKKSAFKIEALLSQSPSAFQINNREMNELTNKGRIKQIIKNFFAEQHLERLKQQNLNSTLAFIHLNDTSQELLNLSHLSNQTFEHCPLSPPNLSEFSFCLFDA